MALHIQDTVDMIGGIAIRFGIGDIAEASADACVVPQFRNCVSEGGVAAALGRAGAHLGVDTEYEAFLSRCVVAPEFGDVHLTPSHGGRIEKLFHAVTVGSGREKEYGAVTRAVRNVLALASGTRIRSIVFPVMGTGIIGQMTDEQSALAMLSAVAGFAARNPEARLDLLVVIYDRNPTPATETLAVFRAVLGSKAYLEATPTVGQREIDPVRWAREMERDITLGRMPADPAAEAEFRTRKDEIPASKMGKGRKRKPAAPAVVVAPDGEDPADERGPASPSR